MQTNMKHILTLHIQDDHWPVAPIPFTHLSEASQHYRQYIEDNGYGARDAGDGLILYKNRIVGRVSYNGKVWRTWNGPEQCLYDPMAATEAEAEAIV